MALQLQVKLLPPRFAHTRLRGPVKVSSRTIELLDPCSECQAVHQHVPFPSASARSKTLLNYFRAGSTCDSFKDFDDKVCFYDILAEKPVLLPASRDPVLAQEACVGKCREVLALRTQAWQEVAFTSCDDVAVSLRLRSSDRWVQEAQFFLQEELKKLEAAKKSLTMPALASMLTEPLPSAFRFVSMAEFLVYCEAERFTRLLLIRTVELDGRVKDNFMFVEPRVGLLGYTLYQLSGTIEQATYFIRHVSSDWFADMQQNFHGECKAVFFALGPAREAAAAPGQVRLEDCQLFTKALTRTCVCKLELKKRFGCCCSANLALYSGEQRGFFLAQYTPGTLAELANIYREAAEAYPDDVHLRTDMIERLKLLLPETGDAEGVQRTPWFKRHGHLPEECTTCHELFYVKIVHAACGHQVACSHFKCFSDFFVDPTMKFRSTRAGQQCPICQSPYPADKYKAQGLEEHFPDEEWTVEGLLQLQRSDFADLLSAPAQQLLHALDSLSASATRFGGGGMFRGGSVEHRLEYKELSACVTVTLRQLEPGRENAFLRRRQRMDLKISSMCVDGKGKQWHCLSAGGDGKMELYPVLYTGTQEYELEAALLLQLEEQDRVLEELERERKREEKALAAAVHHLPLPLVIVADQPRPKRKLVLSDPVAVSKKQDAREEGECSPSSCDDS